MRVDNVHVPCDATWVDGCDDVSGADRTGSLHDGGTIGKLNINININIDIDIDIGINLDIDIDLADDLLIAA